MGDDSRSTRRALLELLLRRKSGLSIDELGAELSISRNAVRQHLASLESEDLVAAGNVRRSVGRPAQLYTITPLGAEQFPKQYSLLAGLLLSTLRDLHGTAGVTALLEGIARHLAGLYANRVQGDDTTERARAMADILNELGYAAQSSQEEITAVNCVYHHLAAEFPEVCQLDIALIGRLTGAQVEQTECMLRGGELCRFRLR
jgi:predicted ArsR family transcriptional regulator